MQINERDFSIIEHIYSYCVQIDEAHAQFKYSFESFSNNSIYKNAISLCILQIGELTNHLTESFKIQNPQIQWKQIKGMRNIVAHQYGIIDISAVWETSCSEITELKDFCANIIRNE